MIVLHSYVFYARTSKIASRYGWSPGELQRTVFQELKKHKNDICEEMNDTGNSGSVKQFLGLTLVAIYRYLHDKGSDRRGNSRFAGENRKA